MFDRLRRLWSLTRKDPEQIEKLLEVPKEVLESIPERGDGKAVFISEGSEEDFKEQQIKDSGMSGWYRRIRNL